MLFCGLRRTTAVPAGGVTTVLLKTLILLLVLGISMNSDHSAVGDETNGSESDSTEAQSWAIAIHGGAGSDPAKWDPGKRSARLEGLTEALALGREVLSGGGKAIDAVEQVIRTLEDNASFNAGRGAVLTTEGKAELDASIMDGASSGCGAVASVTRVKNPISLARLVMERTPHVLLVGDGAEEFAERQQVDLVNSDYFLSRVTPFQNRDVAPPVGPTQILEQPDDPDESRGPRPHFGTVGCVALDTAGDLAAGTSTGGTAKKLPGRVGDSPIVGAGTYAANGVCGVSGTGKGEEYIRNAIAYDVAAQMRYADRTLSEAVTRIIHRKLEAGVGGLIAVGADGAIVLQHNTPGMSCAAADSRGRFDTYLQLERGGAPVHETRGQRSAD